MAISTRNLAALPGLVRLEQLCRCLAMLDAIMSPDWKYRYFLYDPIWGGAADERMASMDNGSGDGYFLVFSAAGAFLKGFDHESSMTPWAHDPLTVWPGLFNGVPLKLQAYLKEPAFDMESTTFCVWRLSEDAVWQRGEIEFPEGEADPDGSEDLLWMFNDNPATYVKFCQEYYEKAVDHALVSMFYAETPLAPEMITKLNTECSWQEALQSAIGIRYPVG